MSDWQAAENIAAGPPANIPEVSPPSTDEISWSKREIGEAGKYGIRERRDCYTHYTRRSLIPLYTPC